MSPEPERPGEEAGTEGREAAPKKARKRSQPAPPVDVNAAFIKLLEHPRLQPEFRPRETPADADHRRRKEFLNLLVKELSPFAVAILFLVTLGFYCFYTLLNPSTSPEAKERAWAAVTIILSGVVEFVFGKAAGK